MFFKIILSFFSLILASLNIYSQTSMRSTVRLDGAISTGVRHAHVSNDKVIVTGFNFYGDSSHIYSCVLDTNLNVLNYIDHRKIDPKTVSGNITMTFTDDGGYLIAKQVTADSVSYGLTKFSADHELEWYERQYSDISKEINKIIETDSTYMMYGNMGYRQEENPDVIIHGMYIDIVDKNGISIDTKILFENEGFVKAGDLQIQDSSIVASFNYKSNYSSTPMFSRRNKIIEYDFDYNIIREWEDVGYVNNIHPIDDGYIASTWYQDDIGFGSNVPQHYVNRYTKDLDLEWTKGYLKPPFKFVHDFGNNNVIRIMWPDPRGGFYVVGDLAGPEGAFHTPPYDAGGELYIGASLLKVDEDGNEIWQYKDPYNFIYPEAANTLSSGNILIVGQGSIIAEDGYWSSTVSAIKLDKNGCHIPGCHTDTSVPEVEAEVDMRIYPNPVVDILNISNGSDQPINQVSISTSTGAVIMEIRSNDISQIDISELNNGLYIISAFSGGESVYTDKFIKV